MKTSLRDLLSSPAATRSLRRIAIGAALAVAGAFGFSSIAPISAATSTPNSIVNRAEKKGKLVLQLATSDSKLTAQHRSHSSHSSHASHRSHSSRTR